MTKFLAISGSLRAVSLNTEVLLACQKLAPEDMMITLYQGIADLPHFNPDLDGDQPPQTVQALRDLIGASDGLIISCPEYAHGIPGSFKNTLDWLVSSLEFPEKPVILINTSPYSERITPLLSEVLSTMSARIVTEANLALALKGSKLDADGIAASKEFAPLLHASLVAFAAAASAR